MTRRPAQPTLLCSPQTMNRPGLRRLPLFRRHFASASHGPVPFNEPGGHLFQSEKGQEVDWAQKIYIAAYLGGLAAFAFLWQYKPDTSAESWGREEALKRMKARGVDLSSL